jgi:hypothetical protein
MVLQVEVTCYVVGRGILTCLTDDDLLIKKIPSSRSNVINYESLNPTRLPRAVRILASCMEDVAQMLAAMYLAYS